MLCTNPETHRNISSLEMPQTWTFCTSVLLPSSIHPSFLTPPMPITTTVRWRYRQVISSTCPCNGLYKLSSFFVSVLWFKLVRFFHAPVTFLKLLLIICRHFKWSPEKFYYTKASMFSSALRLVHTQVQSRTATHTLVSRDIHLCWDVRKDP